MANPFLVLGGVAVGVITAGIGVLAVPGWIDSAHDSAAMNDLGNIRGAESAAILQLGEYTDDLGVLRSGELGVKFQKSDTVTLIGLEADSNESWCASVLSKSGRYFAASSDTARFATSSRGAEGAMLQVGCDADLISEIIADAGSQAGQPGADGGEWVGGSPSDGSGNPGGGTPGGGDVDPEPVAQTITWSINCPAPADVALPLPGASGTVTWSDGETYPADPLELPARTVPAGVNLKVSFTGEVYSQMMVADRIVSPEALPCYRALDSFGPGTGISMMLGAFKDMTNLTSVPSTIPSGITNMEEMFQGATSFNDNISGWDVSAVETLSKAFDGATSFNGPLNGWDVSNVTDFGLTFRGATSFNQPLDQWRPSSAESMQQMFDGATSFNGSLAGWQMPVLWNLSGAFNGATSFNQPVGSWNVSSVVDVTNMFYGASSFAQDISAWDLSNAIAPSSTHWYGSGLNNSLVPAAWRN